MPEPTKSTQEAGKTPGSTTGSSTESLGGGAGSGMTGGAAGHSTGQPLRESGQTSQTTSGSATRQAREHSSSKYDQSRYDRSGYDLSGSSSTMEREVGEITDQTRRAGMPGMAGETRRARQSVSDTYYRASHGLNETWEQAMDYGREHPGRSTLIAFGVGVGVGLLMANGFATRSRTQRIVPPVMNALSEIATELFR